MAKKSTSVSFKAFKKSNNFSLIVSLIVGALLIAGLVGFQYAAKQQSRTRSKAAVNTTNINTCFDAFNVPLSQCNERCNQDAECTGGFFCLKDSSGNGYCRRNTNPYAVTCEPTSAACNSVCKIDTDCPTGLTCLRDPNSPIGIGYCRKQPNLADTTCGSQLRCNDLCSSDSQCPIAHFCLKDAAGNGYCRRNTNPYSATCDSITPACNSICRVNTDCPTSMTCLKDPNSPIGIGYCRLPNNLSDARCTGPTATPTRGVTITPPPITATPTKTPTPSKTPTKTPTPFSTPTKTPTPSKTPTKTPTPTQTACVVCQYKVDTFWGPAVKSFVDGTVYTTPYNRLLATQSSATNVPACYLDQPTPYPINPTNVPAACRDSSGKPFLTATITRPLPGQTTITANIRNTATNQNCIYEVGFASYKTNVALSNWVNLQIFHDYRLNQVYPGQNINLTVRLPLSQGGEACYNL